MKLLALVTDAYGGRGGIAKFNRDLLAALCSHPACDEVVALPRVIFDESGVLPEGLTYFASSAGSKARYVTHLRRTLTTGRFAGVICGHINLLPLAALAARQQQAPLLLIVHGVEAWAPTSRLRRYACRYVDSFVAVSEFTKQRFIAWSGVSADRGTVVPNCIDASLYGIAPKRSDLVARYGLEGRAVLLTLGRLSASERYKGIDEVLEVLPTLVATDPSITYVIAGDGNDRRRLEAKVAALDLNDHVLFTGFVAEEEKADHFRLADVFVMAGWGEGFGIVYLEAMACGVPVVASAADASQEVVRDGGAGFIAHPDRPTEIVEAIQCALAQRQREIPPRLADFSFDLFEKRWHRVLARALAIPGESAYAAQTAPDGGASSVIHHNARIPC
jgi:glycosyltransferase involved in cell wall biosynthesis